MWLEFSIPLMFRKSTLRGRKLLQLRSGTQNEAINKEYAHTRTKDDTAPEEAIKLTWGESTTGATQFIT